MVVSTEFVESKADTVVFVSTCQNLDPWFQLGSSELVDQQQTPHTAAATQRSRLRFSGMLLRPDDTLVRLPVVVPIAHMNV